MLGSFWGRVVLLFLCTSLRCRVPFTIPLNRTPYKALQEKLKTLGYDPGTIDGNYGTKTVSAVKAFQKDHLLTVDGIAGMATQAAIDEAVKGGIPSGTPEPTDGVYLTIDQANKIKEYAQAILDAIGEVRFN